MGFLRAQGAIGIFHVLWLTGHVDFPHSIVPFAAKYSSLLSTTNPLKLNVGTSLS